MVLRDLLVTDKLGTCSVVEKNCDSRQEVYNLHETNKHNFPYKESQNCYDRLNNNNFLGENPISLEILLVLLE
jgi:hypothetical protein